MYMRQFEFVVSGDQATSVRVLSDGHIGSVQHLLTLNVTQGALAAATTTTTTAAAGGGDDGDDEPLQASADGGASLAKTRHVVRVRSMPHSRVRTIANHELLLSAAIELDVAPPLTRALSPALPLRVEWPAAAVATLAAPTQRRLCVAAYRAVNASSGWHCIGVVRQLALSNDSFVWQANLTELLPFSLRYEPSPPLPTADFKTPTR
jgi:hypothetical protein